MMAAGLMLPGPVRADGIDPLRCDAISVRKEGQLYDCLGRCERRNGWRIIRLGSAADDKWAECRSDCEQRYVAAMERLMTMDFCVGHGGGTCMEDPSAD